MKIGVYVGSFNPVHIGHIKIVDDLLIHKIVDRVVIIPTNGYWNKQNLVDLKHRINMLKYFENDKIIIDTKHNSIEYTYQVLDKLEKEYKNDELYLIIGADQLPKFHLWKNVGEILKHKVLVINRDNIDVYQHINNFKNKENFIIVNDIEQIDISSTIIRDNIDKRDCYLDKNVLKYINKNKLY